ncbi:unnamed protein product [Cylicocyclus nassatus]|uniref:Uncharacterized protein n=1 Tax=Cylicocyclus nassatus TaxID=53992 RepID=A0AA36GRG0_CYLNA|nr:unnamed protein product [Cylicocyclus nassatus]
MRCLIVLSVATVTVLAYGRQSSGYETAELYQPAPAVPLSADGGNQQAYNSDGATVVVSSPPPTPAVLPISSVAPVTSTLITTGPALVPVAGAIPIGTNGGLTGVTRGAVSVGLTSVNSGVPVATNGGFNGVNIPVVTRGGNTATLGASLVRANGGLNGATGVLITVGNANGLRRRFFRHRVRRVRF